MGMLHSLSVKDYMEANLATFKPDQEVLQAMRVLIAKEISAGPVVNHLGDLCGILSEKDCLKIALNAGYYGDLGGTVEEYMSSNPVTVDVDASILDVAKLFLDAPYKCYPVMQDNRLVGQINRHDVLRAIEHVSQESSFP
jgi:CBS domain-containing protein